MPQSRISGQEVKVMCTAITRPQTPQLPSSDLGNKKEEDTFPCTNHNPTKRDTLSIGKCDTILCPSHTVWWNGLTDMAATGKHVPARVKQDPIELEIHPVASVPGDSFSFLAMPWKNPL